MLNAHIVVNIHVDLLQNLLIFNDSDTIVFSDFLGGRMPSPKKSHLICKRLYLE